MLLSISELSAYPSVVPNSLHFDRKHRSKLNAFEKMPLKPPKGALKEHKVFSLYLPVCKIVMLIIRPQETG